MKAIQINKDISIIIGGDFPNCNTIVILDDEPTIIDPGCNYDDLRKFLNDKGLEPRHIKNVLISHIHPDHITHAARIQRLARCNVIANEITAPLFNDKEEMRAFLGFTKGHPVRVLWENLVNEKMYGALDEGKVTITVKDRDTIQTGNYSLQMQLAPGHTPDHMCIFLVDEKLLYTADIDCTPFGPYYGHPNSSIPEFGTSIRTIVDSNHLGIISGHLEDPMVFDYREQLMRFWSLVMVRENKVLEAIRSGAKSILQITENPIIYPSLSNLVYLQFETWMIEHHIKSLLNRGLIEETKNGLEAVHE